MVAGCGPSLAQSAAPEYSVRGDAHTGSAIRSKLVSGGNLPVNKRYDELTADDKELVNQWYESIGPGDEPPFPAQGLKPVYTAMARLHGELQAKGQLILIATVDARGDVTQVKAVGNPDPELTKFAATVLALTNFKPALCKGVPCKMDFPFSFQFK
jgi:hypothetical protein